MHKGSQEEREKGDNIRRIHDAVKGDLDGLFVFAIPNARTPKRIASRNQVIELLFDLLGSNCRQRRAERVTGDIKWHLAQVLAKLCGDGIFNIVKCILKADMNLAIDSP